MNPKSIDKKRRTILGLPIAAGLAVLSSPVRANDLRVGKQAPPLVLHTLDGQRIATRDLIGHVVIVAFWASWCAPCRQELPLLSAYAESHKNQKLTVLGFCLDGPENLVTVRNIASGLDFPVGLLGSPWAGGYGRIWRIPVGFVIDRSGNLAFNGWDDSSGAFTEEKLKRWVDPLLNAPVVSRMITG